MKAETTFVSYPPEIDDHLGPEAAAKMSIGEPVSFAVHASRPAFGFGGLAFLLVLTSFAVATFGFHLNLGLAAILAVTPSTIGLVVNRATALTAPPDSLLRLLPFGPVGVVGSPEFIRIFLLTDSGHGLENEIGRVRLDEGEVSINGSTLLIRAKNQPSLKLQLLKRSVAGGVNSAILRRALEPLPA